MSKRNQILQEIILTERIYLTNMQTLLSAYGHPLQKNPALLPTKDYHIVFADISVIVNVATGLLQALEKLDEEEHSAKKPTLTLGQIFLKFGPMFKSYTSYCNKYDQIMQILRQRKAESEEFKQFLLQQKQEAKGTGIDSFLINPVQRIPRYNLLLREMLQNTSTMHRDYETLQQALQTMRATADHVNSRMEEYERRQRLTELASTIQGLPFELVAPHRTWHREADVNVLLMKDMARLDTLDMDALPPQRVFLFDDMVIVCKLVSGVSDGNGKKDKKEKSKKRNSRHSIGENAIVVKYEHHLHLNEDPFPWIADLDDKDKIKHAFQIVTAADNYTLSFPSDEQKKEWVESVADLLDKISISKPELRKNRAKYKKQLHMEDMLNDIDQSDQDKISKKKMSPLGLIKKRKSKKSITMNDSFDTLIPIGSILFPGNMPKRSDIPCLTSDELGLFQDLPRASYVSIVRALYSYNPQEEKRQEETEPSKVQTEQSSSSGKRSKQKDAAQKDHRRRSKGEADELSFEKGDILLIIQKNVGKSTKWWVARKVGLSVDPNVRREKHMADDYNELKELQKKKLKEMSRNKGGITPRTSSPSSSPQSNNPSPGKLTRMQSHVINVSYINGLDGRELDVKFDNLTTPNTAADKLQVPTATTTNTEINDTKLAPNQKITAAALPEEGIQRRKSKSLFLRRKTSPSIVRKSDQETANEQKEAEQMKQALIEQEERLLSGVINVVEENNQVGLIANRYFVEFCPELWSRVMQVVEERDRLEERKVRNFIVKKRVGPSSLAKHAKKENENVSEFHIEVERRKSRASANTAASSMLIQRDLQSMKLDDDVVLVKSPRLLRSPRKQNSSSSSSSSSSTSTTLTGGSTASNISQRDLFTDNDDSTTDNANNLSAHYSVPSEKPASRRRSIFGLKKSKK